MNELKNKFTLFLEIFRMYFINKSRDYILVDVRQALESLLEEKDKINIYDNNNYNNINKIINNIININMLYKECYKKATEEKFIYACADIDSIVIHYNKQLCEYDIFIPLCNAIIELANDFNYPNNNNNILAIKEFIETKKF